MKNITINGVDFELVTGKKAAADIIADVNRTNLVNITDLYNRPSNTKINIFSDWTKWYYEIEKISGRFGCMRGGSSTFSIGGYIETADNDIYLYITKNHNKAVLV